MWSALSGYQNFDYRFQLEFSLVQISIFSNSLRVSSFFFFFFSMTRGGLLKNKRTDSWKGSEFLSC